MASLMSAIGGATLAVGALLAVRFLLTLTTGPAWRRPRAFARATRPRHRLPGATP